MGSIWYRLRRWMVMLFEMEAERGFLGGEQVSGRDACARVRHVTHVNGIGGVVAVCVVLTRNTMVFGISSMNVFAIKF